MADHPIALLQQHLSTVDAPPVERTRAHDLTAILTIAVCAVVGGADSWVDSELFGNAQRDWFAQWLDLPTGSASHATFRRVFTRIDPQQFQHSFLSWVGAFVSRSDGHVIAVDGTTLCGSGERRNGRTALHLVSAWATANGMVRGQQAVDAKSNEIPAVPALLRLLDLQGAIVTLDALNCQTAAAEQIVAGDADYILALNGTPHAYLTRCRQPCGLLHTPTLLTSPTAMQAQSQKHTDGSKSATCGMLRSRRTISGHTTEELRYYLLSINDATCAIGAMRAHWGVENPLPWVVDGVFGEDARQGGGAHGAQTLAVLRHMALTLLKQHPAKLSIRSKRNKAGWDTSFLHQVVFGLDA